MHNKYLFSNMIGTFVFNEHFNIIKSVMFTNNEDYSKKEEYEKEFLEKYPDLKVPKGIELAKILAFFKKKQYAKEFFEKNLKLTKKLVKESVQGDILIIQAISNIGDIDKASNTLVKRLRDWYELYNPEFSHAIQEHNVFVELILENDKKALLKNLKIDEKETMGADLSKEDLTPILNLAKRTNELFRLRKEQEAYLESLMKKVCPNMLAITGATIGAKLLSQAGSLKRLSQFPASTIQLLGAEKAFFRHLKTGAKSPRHGFIVQHSLLATAPNKVHGRIARALADKIAIAVKVDYFKGKFIGDKLRIDLEKRFKR